MLWEIDIYPASHQRDRKGREVSVEAADLGWPGVHVDAGHGYLLQGDLEDQDVRELARKLLADPLVERTVIAPVGDPLLAAAPGPASQLVHVLPKPGVTDPVAESALRAARDLGYPVDAVRTFRKYWLGEQLPASDLAAFCWKALANESIEELVIGPLNLTRLQLGTDYTFSLVTVPLRSLDDAGLETLSRDGQLYLTLTEMQTIQSHFRQLDRDPTDIELETIAQTWSEHCSHKTLAGRIAYRDERGERQFDNMLKETIFAATQQIRRELGDADWCVSVFEDNAGVIEFDENYHVVFKVETHNHPSALEPYGGANTGIGGVIRDPLGTGLGAKPICNTDVFCFAPPDTPREQIPPGVLHPRRVMKGVVAGVRDYGNRMGIPTVNGAVYFDPRYLGNPLVYCGNVGLLPVDKVSKRPRTGDLIVAVGGRTGRDGIHGATFSSAELTSESESLSGGAVQIGNAITEKMVLDVILQARDRGLYHAITDCGAGGFSSAVGEMGESLGAVVDLEKPPLKYAGLTYTEIWISEAQERMVLAVPPAHWEEFHELCAAEGVEATVIGEFADHQQLVLRYHGTVVGQLAMEFLHEGRPPVVRQATYAPPETRPLAPRGGEAHAAPQAPAERSAGQTLRQILQSLNVASKEWVIRQYDHEVQGGSVIKPLVGIANDGPGDAAVVRPVLNSTRGIAVSCGMNPHLGDLDPYDMAANAIDEAVRNCVAVGADPARIAILDNFCWGYTDRPETLGSLVRAALACQEVAVALQTPFISGKDSLNNEFSYVVDGVKQTIAIPPTLLISALGIVPDIRRCVTMDLKRAGNALYQVGATAPELGGSHYCLVRNLAGGHVPRVRPAVARRTFQAVHEAIVSGAVRACHDLSEGGLAAAAAEMAFSGGLGAALDLSQVPVTSDPAADALHGSWADTLLVTLFAESSSRFLCEIAPENQQAFEDSLNRHDVPWGKLGAVTASGRLVCVADESAGEPVLDEDLAELKQLWQAPLNWS